MVDWPYWSMHDLGRTCSEHLKLIGYTASEVFLELNCSDNSVTVKHNFGGQLAKDNLLRRMCDDVWRQVYYYLYEGGGAKTIVAPENYVTVTLIWPELTEGEWLADQEGLTKMITLSFNP